MSKLINIFHMAQWFPDPLEAWLKVHMFRALKRYQILEYRVEKLENLPLYRTYVRVNDLLCRHTVESMAEGHSPGVAKLRALAESYEKICWNEYQNGSNPPLDKSLPYGFGVGFRQRSATLRAYGEYWERRTFSAMAGQRSLLPDERVRDLQLTPAGKVFQCFLCAKDGSIGTGYGLTASQAHDSAARSAVRKASYPQESPRFNIPSSPPLEVRITPPEGAWLECLLIGHFKAANS